MFDSSKRVKKIVSKWLLNEGIKKPGSEFNFRWAPIGLRTTEWVLSNLQTLMLDLVCLLILQFLIVFIHKREVYFFVLQCWKSKWPTAKMQVNFTSTYTNGKRTSILPLQTLQITVCNTCCLQSEKKNIYIHIYKYGGSVYLCIKCSMLW